MTATPHSPGRFPFGTTWVPLIQEWARSLTSENKSPNTIRIYTLVPSQMATWLAGWPGAVDPTFAMISTTAGCGLFLISALLFLQDRTATHRVVATPTGHRVVHAVPTPRAGQRVPGRDR